MSKKLSFEEAMQKLEETADRLETGDLPLEEALAEYEAGRKYYQQCEKILQAAKQKIETYRSEEDQ